MILGASTPAPAAIPEIVGSASRITPLKDGYPDLGLSLTFDGSIATKLKIRTRALDPVRQSGILMPKGFPETWLEAGVNLSSPRWERGHVHGIVRTSEQLSACIGPYGRDGMAVEVWTVEGYALLPWVDFSGLGKDHSYSLLEGVDFGGRIREAGPGHQALVNRAGADLRLVELGFGAQALTGQAPWPDGSVLPPAAVGQSGGAQ
ncbi:hypothetical protein [Streptomyces sp. ISL-11]|uniref:hypothetical protein n=1 Tax=Streptomyces sp. ISL-11 TaxID=2819174 RepID=UPI001BE8F968|nr:hypothetical protein [Streptomyces sp. ISL-11]MBT2383835.1 hypothetical protein [Streptomyces sp. ISL-11]